MCYWQWDRWSGSADKRACLSLQYTTLQKFEYTRKSEISVKKRKKTFSESLPLSYTYIKQY